MGRAHRAKPPEAIAAERGLLMTNPPYGERLGELPELVRLLPMGEKAKALFLVEHWHCTGNPNLPGHRLGLRAHKQYALKNGALDAKLLLMEIATRTASTPDSDSVSSVSENAGEAQQTSTSAKPAVSEMPKCLPIDWRKTKNV